MRKVVLSIRLKDNWVRDLSEKFGAKVHIHRSIPIGDRLARDLVEIKIKEGGSAEEIISYLKKRPDLDDVEMVVAGKNTIVGAVTVTGCAGCFILPDKDSFLISAETGENHEIIWHLVVRNGENLKKLIDHLKNAGCEVEIKKVSPLNIEEMLTEKEEEIIYIAYKRGYFDYPKKIGIRELAKMFNVSPSTLSESLRRGQRKIMEKYFSEMAHEHIF
ncbi:MAG: hypothetical protein DRN20_04030 [Thermoplasmata archaeon]|nr:MAG: hypothetical protein DRN20_04030 [Thermoplasmata archaeon]